MRRMKEKTSKRDNNETRCLRNKMQLRYIGQCKTKKIINNYKQESYKQPQVAATDEREAYLWAGGALKTTTSITMKNNQEWGGI